MSLSVRVQVGLRPANRSKLRFSSRSPASPSPSVLFPPRPFLFFRLFSVDQVLSARSRFYCARTRDSKEISAHAKGKWTKDSRATLLRVSEESKLLKRLRSQIPAPLFHIRSELSIAREGCFSRGTVEENIVRTKTHEIMKECNKEILEEFFL